MLRSKLLEASLVAAVMAFSASYASAQEFSARLSGFQEIGGLGAGETGAILSGATGTLRLDLDKAAGTLGYTLTYTSGLSSPVLFAHIHFGKVHVAGNVVVFLCTNASVPPPPAATPPACPTPSGTVSGTLKPTDVVASGQNITAGDFDALADALTSNTAYVNVHTNNFKSGEIRGQIRSEDREDRGD